MGRVVYLCVVLAALAGKIKGADKADDKARILAGALGHLGANSLGDEKDSVIDENYYYYEDYPEQSATPGQGKARMGDARPGNREPFLQDLINLQRQHSRRNDKIQADAVFRQVGTEQDADPEQMNNPQGPSGASPLGAWAGLASYGFGDVQSPAFNQFYGPLSVGNTRDVSANLNQIEYCPRTADNGIKYYCLKLEGGLYYDPWNPFCGYIECSSGVGTRICCNKGSWMGLMMPVTTTQKDLCRKKLEKPIVNGQCPKQTDFNDLCTAAENIDGIISHSTQLKSGGTAAP